MAGKKRSSADKAAKQAVKAAEQNVKALRKKQRDLLKKSGKSIVDFRSDIAKLKRLGIVSKRTDARKVEPSRYRRGQISKFFDVLVGTKTVVKAPKTVRRKYADKGLYEERGGFLVIPREHEKQRQKIRKGLVEITKPLANGEIQEIVLAYNSADILALANAIESDPTLADVLDGVDQYAFSLFGHNSHIGFPNKAELVDYIKVRYTHLFKGNSGRQAVAHFKLIKYGGGAGFPPAGFGGDKIYSDTGTGRRPNITGRDWFSQKQYETRAARDRKRRKKMTDEERAAYNEAGKKRAAAYYKRQKEAKDGNGNNGGDA